MGLEKLARKINWLYNLQKHQCDLNLGLKRQLRDPQSRLRVDIFLKQVNNPTLTLLIVIVVEKKINGQKLFSTELEFAFQIEEEYEKKTRFYEQEIDTGIRAESSLTLKSQRDIRKIKSSKNKFQVKYVKEVKYKDQYFLEKYSSRCALKNQLAYQIIYSHTSFKNEYFFRTNQLFN